MLCSNRCVSVVLLIGNMPAHQLDDRELVSATRAERLSDGYLRPLEMFLRINCQWQEVLYYY